MKKNIENQQTFDFDAAPKAPPVMMNADVHRWWAQLCRSAHDHCVAQAAKALSESEIGEWAAIAKVWTAQAGKHDSKADLLEGERG